MDGENDGRRLSAEGVCGQERKGARSIERLLAEFDEQWPSLKFFGFGCYYAWIWLSYNSGVLVQQGSGATSSGAMLTMYLLSTTALASVLIVSSLAYRKVERALTRIRSVLGAGLLAGASTLAVGMTASLESAHVFFWAASILTGVGTSWVALRLGMVYGSVPARQAVMYSAASFILACMLYFVATGLPHVLGLPLTASLPVLAAFCAVLSGYRPQDAGLEPKCSEDDLPKGFFARLVVAVAIFAIVVGITRGFATMNESLQTVSDQGVVIAFGTATIAAVVFFAVALLVRDFDISRLYYPATILAAAGILIMPCLSIMFGIEGDSVFEGQAIGIAYALFIMVIWCLCSHVSYVTSISSIRVFGWGRGASAAGTTVGWLMGFLMMKESAADGTFLVGISIAMAFVLLIVAMLVFNDRAIGQVLSSARGKVFGQEDSRYSQQDASGFEMSSTNLGPEEMARREGSWTKGCNAIAAECKLSPREREVLFLLSKGRTIDYIHNELGISFNTAKTHIRNVYTKIGVHTRQELLDMVEEHRR